MNRPGRARGAGFCRISDAAESSGCQNFAWAHDEEDGNTTKALAAGVAKVLQRLHYPLDVMFLCVRRYVAYSLSLRKLEEMMAERAIGLDHSTVHRWVIKLVPLFKKTFSQAHAHGGQELAHE